MVMLRIDERELPGTSGWWYPRVILRSLAQLDVLPARRRRLPRVPDVLLRASAWVASCTRMCCPTHQRGLPRASACAVARPAGLLDSGRAIYSACELNCLCQAVCQQYDAALLN